MQNYCKDEEWLQDDPIQGKGGTVSRAALFMAYCMVPAGLHRGASDEEPANDLSSILHMCLVASSLFRLRATALLVLATAAAGAQVVAPHLGVFTMRLCRARFGLAARIGDGCRLFLVAEGLLFHSLHPQPGE